MPRMKILGKHHKFIFPEEIKEEMDKIFRKYSEGQKITEVKSKLLTSSGETIPVVVSVNLIKLETRTLVQGIFKEFSKQKDYENRVVNSLTAPDESFRSLAELLPDSIYEIRMSDLKLMYLNESGVITFGFTKEDLENGVYLNQVLHPDDLERAEDRIRQLLSGGSKFLGVYRGMKKDGEIFPVEVQSLIIYDGKEPAGVRGVVRDISGISQHRGGSCLM
jgi:PAS domain S-box-containing protein